MNSAVLGLKLLLGELALNGDSHDAEHLETVDDVSKSVTAAVDILDGLLCFDKLENGIMELRKQEVSVIDFLNDCVKPFAPQAREKRTELRLLFAKRNEEASESESRRISILPNLTGEVFSSPKTNRVLCTSVDFTVSLICMRTI